MISRKSIYCTGITNGRAGHLYPSSCPARFAGSAFMTQPLNLGVHHHRQLQPLKLQPKVLLGPSWTRRDVFFLGGNRRGREIHLQLPLIFWVCVLSNLKLARVGCHGMSMSFSYVSRWFPKDHWMFGSSSCHWDSTWWTLMLKLD